MTTSETDATSPLIRALGRELEQAAPAVQFHLRMNEPRCSYEGRLRRVWARGALGRLTARLLRLPRSTTTRFVVRNELVDGGMLWHRTMTSAEGSMEARGLMVWDPELGALVDRLGKKRRFWVELLASLEHGTVSMVSRRLWLRCGSIRLRLPRWLLARALITEWEEPPSGIGLGLALDHRLFGSLAGYEVVLQRRGDGS